MNWHDEQRDPLDIANLKIELLESEIGSYQSEIARLHIAYRSILWLHADLMISTIDREGIRDALAEQYAFDLPNDAHVDLRAALNQQFKERAQRNRMVTAQTEDTAA